MTVVEMLKISSLKIYVFNSMKELVFYQLNGTWKHKTNQILPWNILVNLQFGFGQQAVQGSTGIYSNTRLYSTIIKLIGICSV